MSGMRRANPCPNAFTRLPIGTESEASSENPMNTVQKAFTGLPIGIESEASSKNSMNTAQCDEENSDSLGATITRATQEGEE